MLLHGSATPGARRWDSLRLFTPAKYDGLPGLPFPGDRLAFPTKDEQADYLEAYSKEFALPILSGIRVDGLHRERRSVRRHCGRRAIPCGPRGRCHGRLSRARDSGLRQGDRPVRAAVAFQHLPTPRRTPTRKRPCRGYGELWRGDRPRRQPQPPHVGVRDPQRRAAVPARREVGAPRPARRARRRHARADAREPDRPRGDPQAGGARGTADPHEAPRSDRGRCCDWSEG